MLPSFVQKLNFLRAWQSHNTHQLVLSLVSRMFSRVLVGYPTCRNEEWLNTSVGYTQAVFRLAGDLRGLHPLLRPLVYPFLTSRRALHKQLKVAEKHLLPLLAFRASSPVDKKDADLLQWMMETAQGTDKKPQILLRKALFLCMASIHTTSTTVCHALYDICANQGLVEPLRIEISEAVKKAGSMTLAAIHDMKLLDSFLKESQRINHPGSRGSLFSIQ